LKLWTTRTLASFAISSQIAARSFPAVFPAFARNINGRTPPPSSAPEYWRSFRSPPTIEELKRYGKSHSCCPQRGCGPSGSRRRRRPGEAGLRAQLLDSSWYGHARYVRNLGACRRTEEGR